jgi:hypothetical protein
MAKKTSAIVCRAGGLEAAIPFHVAALSTI